MSKPTMVPGVPNLTMHLEVEEVRGGEQRVEYGVPIEGRIVPTTFPSTEEGTVRTKLTLEARCGL